MWLIERARVSDVAMPLAESAADGGALVQALTTNGKTTEAVKVIAAALPPREGVWWAWYPRATPRCTNTWCLPATGRDRGAGGRRTVDREP
jgi:hypothetical protein